MRPEAPRDYRFSVEQYYRMGEVGILRPEHRVELLNGIIYDMPPIGPFHAGVETRLQTQLTVAAQGRWLIRAQNPIHLDDGSEPVPDLALVQYREDYYAKCHPQPDEIFLLIEVAQSSLGFDRTEKLTTYARAGIQEYWIVNLKAKSVEVYRGPLPIGEYSHSERLKAGSKLVLSAFPDTQIVVGDLF